MNVTELHGYGVTLRRLTEDKIELVRRWRNDPKIQQYMDYKEYITPEMQKAWFQRINNDHNFYFIIEYEGKEIGLINVKDVDYEKKTGEPGIFIWDDDYLNSDVAMRAGCCQGDFIWTELKLESLYIHILRSNRRAIQMNRYLGYELVPGQENEELQKYVLTFDNMLHTLKRVQKIQEVMDKMKK